jgi:hypothetical protein
VGLRGRVVWLAGRILPRQSAFVSRFLRERRRNVYSEYFPTVAPTRGGVQELADTHIRALRFYADPSTLLLRACSVKNPGRTIKGNVRWGPVVATLVVLVGSASDVHAQATAVPGSGGLEVSVAMQGLLSAQPASDSFVGPPYLDNGLGGTTPGVAIGLTGVTRRRIALALEFSSTNDLEVEQRGRLVEGQAVGRLRDTLFSLLAGYSVRGSLQTRVDALAGISLSAGTPSIDGVPINQRASGAAAEEGDGRVAFTAGLDVARRAGARVSIVGSVRYSRLPRSGRAAEIGVGSNVLRVGAGLQVLLRR